jgi:hypothetical protein
MAQLAKGERLLAQHKVKLARGKAASGDALRESATGSLDDRADGMDKYIPGYNESSPRTQAEKLTDFLTNELHQKKILPARIFAMADTKRSNAVKFSQILDAMVKVLPSLTRDFLDQIPYAFEMNPQEVLSKEDFEMLFHLAAPPGSKSGPSPSGSQAKNKRAIDEDDAAEYTAIIKYFAECLRKEDITPLRFFKKADRNFNQVLTVEELKDQVQISLAESFAGLNFKKLTKALDQNKNGLVEQDEFVELLEAALGSGTDTSQFQRVSGAAGKYGI